MQSWIIENNEYKCLDNIPAASAEDPFVLYTYQTFGNSNIWDKKYSSQCSVINKDLEKLVFDKCITSKTNPNYLSIDDHELTNFRIETHKYMVYFPLKDKSYRLGLWLDYKNNVLENSYWCSWQDSKGDNLLKVFSD